MKKNNLGKLEIIVFICGACVMVLELVGARLLAPYLGTSIYVWASLIGIILGALSLGYWLGGKLADRKPEYVYLAMIISVSAVCIGLIPLFKDAVLRISVLGGIKAGSIMAASFLFIAPSVLLGMVSPYALRLKIKSLKTSGNTVGNLYALSTLGSISGTFLAGFYLIPKFQLTDILFSIGIVLVFIAFLAHSKKLLPSIIILVLILLALPVTKLKKLNSPFLVDKDSVYNHIRIFDTKDIKKRPIRILQLESGPHSGIYLDDADELLFDYSKFYRLGDFFNPKIKKALMIGGGGYSVPRDFLSRHPKEKIDVVEIDSEVTKLAKEYFNLKEDNRLQIFHKDGRSFLNKTQEKYDVIYNDAFNSSCSIPYELTTKEALKKMYGALNDDGALVINIISAIQGPKAEFFLSEIKTIKSVFPKVYIFPINNEKIKAVQNIMVVASKNDNFDLEKKRKEAQNEEILECLDHYLGENLTIPKHTPILTDNYAPVEYLVGKML
jgi:spermidine synthase